MKRERERVFFFVFEKLLLLFFFIFFIFFFDDAFAFSFLAPKNEVRCARRGWCQTPTTTLFFAQNNDSLLHELIIIVSCIFVETERESG